MNRIAMNLSLVLVLLAAGGCSRKPAPNNEAEKHEHEAGKVGDPRIPLEGIRGLRLMKVPEPRLEGRWVPGEAIGDESAQVLLSSPVKGIVSRLLAIPGQNRPVGATLALIQSPELAHLNTHPGERLKALPPILFDRPLDKV